MKNEVINLSDLEPNSSSFYLKKYKKNFTLEPCTAGKLIEISKNFGDFEKLLSIPTAENISKISMSLMALEDARTFSKIDVELFDPITGETEKRAMGGFELLTYSIEGISEQWAMYECILRSVGFNEEKAKKVTEDLKDEIHNQMDKALNPLPVKKKTTKKKK